MRAGVKGADGGAALGCFGCLGAFSFFLPAAGEGSAGAASTVLDFTFSAISWLSPCLTSVGIDFSAEDECIVVDEVEVEGSG